MPVFSLAAQERALVAGRKKMLKEFKRIGGSVKEVATDTWERAEDAVNDKIFDLNTEEMLQNGGGGLCLPAIALRPADILVTTTNAAVSWGIKIGTGSTISHAAMAIGEGRVIDSTFSGVAIRSINSLLSGSTVGVAFRHKGMTNDLSKKIVDLARSKLESPYDTSGAFLAGGLSDLIGDNGIHLQKDDAFYCSELVVWAYYEAGLPISGVSSKANAPDALPESADMRYVGHVKAT